MKNLLVAVLVLLFFGELNVASAEFNKDVKNKIEREAMTGEIAENQPKITIQKFTPENCQRTSGMIFKEPFPVVAVTEEAFLKEAKIPCELKEGLLVIKDLGFPAIGVPVGNLAMAIIFFDGIIIISVEGVAEQIEESNAWRSFMTRDLDVQDLQATIAIKITRGLLFNHDANGTLYSIIPSYDTCQDYLFRELCRKYKLMGEDAKVKEPGIKYVREIIESHGHDGILTRSQLRSWLNENTEPIKNIVENNKDGYIIFNKETQRFELVQTSF